MFWTITLSDIVILKNFHVIRYWMFRPGWSFFPVNVIYQFVIFLDTKGLKKLLTMNVWQGKWNGKIFFNRFINPRFFWNELCLQNFSKHVGQENSGNILDKIFAFKKKQLARSDLKSRQSFHEDLQKPGHYK